MLSPVITLLLSGAALAAIAAKIVTMQGDLEKTAFDRRRLQSEQVNASAVATVKALLSDKKGNPPAIYPEPYLQPAPPAGATTAPVMATQVTSSSQTGGIWGLDQTSNSWGIVLPAGSTGLDASSRFSTLKLKLSDASRIDTASIFAGLAGSANSAQSTEVTIRMVAVNLAAGTGIVPVESADFALSVPLPGKAGAAGKTSDLTVRVQIPQPPPPSCSLFKPSPTTVQLLVSGIATSANLEDTAGNPLGTPISPNPAVSAFGQDKVFLTATTSAPVGSLKGSVQGPGGSANCGAAPSPSPTPTATPAIACANSSTVKWSADGFMEHLSEGLKPARAGTPAACTGIGWPNGGIAKAWGTAMADIDWNLSNNIGFEERGHSITRTVNFVDPPQRGTYKLRIHRWRYERESPGIGIWMHWDRRVTWQGQPFPRSINDRADYVISCDYAGGGGSYSCSWEKKPLTLDDCSLSKRGCTTWQ